MKYKGVAFATTKDKSSKKNQSIHVQILWTRNWITPLPLRSPSWALWISCGCSYQNTKITIIILKFKSINLLEIKVLQKGVEGGIRREIRRKRNARHLIYTPTVLHISVSRLTKFVLHRSSKRSRRLFPSLSSSYTSRIRTFTFKERSLW